MLAVVVFFPIWFCVLAILLGVGKRFWARNLACTIAAVLIAVPYWVVAMHVYDGKTAFNEKEFTR